MANHLTISIIGAVVLDEVSFPDGSTNSSYGGIVYNIHALSSIISPDVIIRPICNLGEDKYEETIALMKNYPAVDTGFMKKTAGNLSRAKLVYKTNEQRDEFIFYPMKPLNKADAVKVRNSDAVLINLVNGSELSIDVLKEIRKLGTSAVLLDVHSKIWQWDMNGRRSRKHFDDWEHWVNCVDIVQMNQEELECTLGTKPGSIEHLRKYAIRILEKGPGIVNITLGSRGSFMCYSFNNKYYYFHCPAINVHIKDVTGCGDSFSAGFLWTYIVTKNPVVSCCAANIIAGLSTEIQGTENTVPAFDIHNDISKWYPEISGKLSSGWMGDEV